MIQTVTWDEIYKIWTTKLWPGRTSPVEPNSAMIFNRPGEYDIDNMKTVPAFFGFVRNSVILGVLSGHLCSDNSYRIRGLWVNKEHRNTGIAQALVDRTIRQGKEEGADFAWALPRVGVSAGVFLKTGFRLVSDSYLTETGENVYCRLDYTDFHISNITPLRVNNRDLA